MFSLKISDSISTGRDQEEGVGTIASLGDASVRDAGDDEQIIFSILKFLLTNLK
jgi:hypothetical protein